VYLTPRRHSFISERRPPVLPISLELVDDHWTKVTTQVSTNLTMLLENAITAGNQIDEECLARAWRDRDTASLSNELRGLHWRDARCIDGDPDKNGYIAPSEREPLQTIHPLLGLGEAPNQQEVFDRVPNRDFVG